MLTRMLVSAQDKLDQALLHRPKREELVQEGILRTSSYTEGRIVPY